MEFQPILQRQDACKNIPEILQSGQVSALIARSLVPRHTDKSPGLPSNQWQLEAKRWFETALAKLQYRLVQYTNISLIKPAVDVDAEQPEIKPSTYANFTELDEILASQCDTQLVRLNGRGQNVSVLGLAVLLFLAVSLWVSSHALRWWADREPPKGEKWARWQRDELLALWRAAEEISHGPPVQQKKRLINGDEICEKKEARGFSPSDYLPACFQHPESSF
ncbi:hypothetical protein CC78DRAFT_585087 [Lojkania enalia]|uniref:Uncharacterized protein n=1 Tax=Lojkania enalia TaxID=147567 RepID=A0A9P4K117_9PLEO|nr:hypothetical protein CC78DRAFT_585087 [Didymosphaeria enalia]